MINNLFQQSKNQLYFIFLPLTFKPGNVIMKKKNKERVSKWKKFFFLVKKTNKVI